MQIQCHFYLSCVSGVLHSYNILLHNSFIGIPARSDNYRQFWRVECHYLSLSKGLSLGIFLFFLQEFSPHIC